MFTCDYMYISPLTCEVQSRIPHHVGNTKQFDFLHTVFFHLCHICAQKRILAVFVCSVTDLYNIIAYSHDKQTLADNNKEHIIRRHYMVFYTHIKNYTPQIFHKWLREVLL